MNKTVLGYTAILLVLLAGCRKKPMPVAEPEPPVFYASAVVDGQQVTLEAGNNDYYMFSSNGRDSNNVRYFNAELKKSGCTAPCASELRFRIEDDKPAQQGSANIDAALSPGIYSMNNRVPDPAEFNSKFIPVVQFKDGSEYKWTLDAGDGQPQVFNSYNFSAILQAHKAYTVTHRYLDLTGCAAEHTNIFYPGGVQTTVTAIKDPSTTMLQYTFACNTQAKSYHWEFGDGKSSNYWKPVHKYESTSQDDEHYTVTLTIVTEQNDTCVTRYQVVAGTGEGCFANFTASFNGIPLPPARPRVTVYYTDPSGVVYSSDKVLQPDHATFVIESSENYNPNERGEATRRMKVRYNCRLGANGVEKPIEGEAVIAVSY
jgi:hypothetical protein